jgi:Mg2+-importing ATPase
MIPDTMGSEYFCVTGVDPNKAASMQTDIRATGLSSEEASKRPNDDGPNEPGRASRASTLVEIVRLFANPLVLILLIASLVAAVLGEQLNAAIIVAIVLLSAAINFVQVHRSQQAAERLRQQVTPTATVLRDGVWAKVTRREVVRGDVIRLAAGDLVPADAQLLEAHDLHVQQAALTGDSLPVEKEAEPHAGQPVDTQGPNAIDRVFLGTSVVSGTATAVVTATGPATAFGDIAARLATKPPETEFERGIRRFGFLIMRTVLFLVLFVFLVSLAARHDPFQSLLFAVALAVGLTPEFLPMIMTVTLGRGAVHMARNKVIVKHLAAIQNFGSMDVLCSDKTGTLTSGDMALDRQVDPPGKATKRPLELAVINSGFETGIKSPLDAAILKSAAPDLSRYSEARRDPVRLRATPPLRRGRRRWQAPVDHEGRS